MKKVSLVPSAQLVRRLYFGAAVSAGLVALGLTPAEAAKTNLTLGMTVEPTGLDPTIAAPVAIGQVTWQNVFEGLVAIDESGKIQPQLARSWEISPMVSAIRSSFRVESNSTTARLSIRQQQNLRWIALAALTR